MMNVKKTRENMTEQALSVESIMRGHPHISLQALSEACRMRTATTEFILEQMVFFGVVQRGAFGRYSLTQEYKNGNF